MGQHDASKEVFLTMHAMSLGLGHVDIGLVSRH